MTRVLTLTRHVASHIWQHALEHPNSAVFGQVQGDQVIRLGEAEESRQFIVPENEHPSPSLTAYYTSFSTLNTDDLCKQADLQPNIVWIAVDMSRKGVLELLGFERLNGQLEPVHIQLLS